jgi:hypothetical protein
MFHHSGCVPSLLLSARPARCGWISRVFAAVLRSRLLPREDGHPVLVIPSLFVPLDRRRPGDDARMTIRIIADCFGQDDISASAHGGCRGAVV